MLGEVRLSRPHSVRRARAALRDLLRRTPVDVVVCQQTWSCVVFGSVVREMGYPLVLWVHMASDGSHWLERAVRFTPPDVVVCNSRFSASKVAHWLPRAPLHVAYCPVSLTGAASPQARREIRRALGADDDTRGRDHGGPGGGVERAPRADRGAGPPDAATQLGVLDRRRRAAPRRGGVHGDGAGTRSRAGPRGPSAPARRPRRRARPDCRVGRVLPAEPRAGAVRALARRSLVRRRAGRDDGGRAARSKSWTTRAAS